MRAELLLEAHRFLAKALGRERPTDLFVRECSRRIFEEYEGIGAEEARAEEDLRKKMERGVEEEEEENEAETSEDNGRLS